MSGADAIELGISARQAKGIVTLARGLAHYEMESSAAAAAQARAYGEAVEAFTRALSATVKYLEEIKAGKARIAKWSKLPPANRPHRRKPV